MMLRALLLLVALAAVAGWWVWLARPAPVITQLDALLPAAEPVERAVLSGFRARFEGRGLVALLSESDESLQAALDHTWQFLDDSAVLHPDIGLEDEVLDLLDELAPFRAELLAAADMAALEQGHINPLQAELRQSLFGLPTSLRLLPIAQDPYNLFGRFALGLLSKTGTELSWEDGYFGGVDGDSKDRRSTAAGAARSG